MKIFLFFFLLLAAHAGPGRKKKPQPPSKGSVNFFKNWIDSKPGSEKKSEVKANVPLSDLEDEIDSQKNRRENELKNLEARIQAGNALDNANQNNPFVQRHAQQLQPVQRPQPPQQNQEEKKRILYKLKQMLWKNKLKFLRICTIEMLTN